MPCWYEIAHVEVGVGGGRGGGTEGVGGVGGGGVKEQQAGIGRCGGSKVSHSLMARLDQGPRHSASPGPFVSIITSQRLYHPPPATHTHTHTER